MCDVGTENENVGLETGSVVVNGCAFYETLNTEAKLKDFSEQPRFQRQIWEDIVGPTTSHILEKSYLKPSDQQTIHMPSPQSPVKVHSPQSTFTELSTSPPHSPQSKSTVRNQHSPSCQLLLLSLCSSDHQSTVPSPQSTIPLSNPASTRLSYDLQIANWETHQPLANVKYISTIPSLESCVAAQFSGGQFQ